MSDNTNEQVKFEQLMEVYKQKIGNKDEIKAAIEHSNQTLEQLIKSENEQISKALRLKDFSEDTQDAEDIQKKYHESEIENNKIIIWLIVVITIGGMLFLLIAILGRIFGFLTDGVLPVISGMVLEVVGVIIKALQTASDKSKHMYFKALEERRDRNVTIMLIKNMKDGAFKNKMIEKVVEAVFGNTNTDNGK